MLVPDQFLANQIEKMVFHATVELDVKIGYRPVYIKDHHELLRGTVPKLVPFEVKIFQLRVMF